MVAKRRVTELVAVPPSTDRRQTGGHGGGDGVVVARQVTRPVRNQQAPAQPRCWNQWSVRCSTPMWDRPTTATLTAMDLTISPRRYLAMADKNPATKPTRPSAKSSTATDKTFTGLTEEEQGAMKARTQELKAETRRGRAADTADGEPDVLAKIAELPPPDRALAQRLHAIIKASAPALSPKTWYGMPAYAKDGKVVCFFQAAHKFKTRYATFGFNDAANLDDGTMWPTAFALTELTAADEAQIAALVKKAAS
jgi:uncharacterized protein YdhG (YjbR/CyaY superfamily)